ncbi:hypothetical protein D3C80_2195860 [compost metagenome]
MRSNPYRHPIAIGRVVVHVDTHLVHATIRREIGLRKIGAFSIVFMPAETHVVMNIGMRRKDKIIHGKDGPVGF